MSVSEQDVTHVAELANLELTATEKTAMLRDLNAVLGYFAQLNELDTATVPPMTQVSEAAGPHLRADQVAPSLARDRVMAAAPDTDGVFFRVPKVIER
jgi:aspartyl-tRNA(Asn)/glutamyl-tRNA(Gln) amidotransferase subunit C